MPHRLVTETLPEKPSVVIVSDGRLPLRELEKALENYQLSPQVISYAQLPYQTPKLQLAYKILLLLPATNPTFEANQFDDNLLAALSPFQDRTVVALTLDTTWEPSSQLPVKPLSTAEKLVVKVSHVLPQAKIVAGLDVVYALATHTSQSVAPALLQAVCSGLDQGKLYDPQADGYFQSWDVFLATLATLVIQPGIQHQTVRGKKLKTTTLVKMLQLHIQRIHGVLPEITASSVSLQSLPSKLAHQTTSAAESPEVFIKAIMPILNSFKLPSQPLPVVPELVPASTPTPVAGTPPSKPHSPAPPITQVIKPQQLDLTTNSSVVAKATPPVVRNITPIDLAERKMPPKLPPTPPKTVTPRREAVEADIDELFKSYRSERKVTQVAEVAHKTKVVKKKSMRKRKLFWAGLVLIVTVIGLGALFGTLNLTSKWLREQVVASAASYGEPLSVTAAEQQALTSLVGAQTRVLQTVLPDDVTSDASTLLHLAESLMRIRYESQQLEKTAITLLQVSSNRSSEKPSEVVTHLNTHSDALIKELSQAETFVEQLELSATPEEAKAWEHFKEAVSRQKKSLAVLQQFQPFIPQLLGIEGKKTFALVFQNHQELRPTGGVIQAVAFVTLDQGVWVDTEVKSALEIDRALSGELQAPPDAARFLNRKTWSFQDVAWSPDAPTASQDLLKFLNEGTNKNVDGVIFVNPLALNAWLKAVGPLDLPEFKEVVTDKNLLERLESHSEIPLTENAGPDYASTLLAKLLDKTQGVSEEKMPQLLMAWKEQLDQKQLSFVPAQAETLAGLQTLGWAGGLTAPLCPPPLQQERCLVDTVAQVESNIGSNKANIYLDRVVTHQVDIAEDGIYHQRSITFTNKANSEAWPKGAYKTYLRLYVSPTARLEGINIQGQDLAAKDVVIAFENNRQVFGAAVEVPIQQSVTVTYRYFLPTTPSSPFSYALFTQFQPGIKNPPYRVSFTSDSYSPKLIAPQAQVKDKTVTFTSPTSLHSLVGVRFE